MKEAADIETRKQRINEQVFPKGDDLSISNQAKDTALNGAASETKV